MKHASVTAIAGHGLPWNSQWVRISNENRRNRLSPISIFQEQITGIPMRFPASEETGNGPKKLFERYYTRRILNEKGVSIHTFFDAFPCGMFEFKPKQFEIGTINKYATNESSNLPNLFSNKYKKGTKLLKIMNVETSDFIAVQDDGKFYKAEKMEGMKTEAN
ncbi:hypothetical protein [Cohnella nanjingensis]|uniref:Uncharacterized protein n=1 Tax=Cohnella nanjingensis TaxID=1387779 RepID=A0A7X0RY60_9BACL|nr:hypothetical protein [Cohnella nanjingensis]MBB6674626.1 hypothetical protein [Cohnella nanjingensis]